MWVKIYMLGILFVSTQQFEFPFLFKKFLGDILKNSLDTEPTYAKQFSWPSSNVEPLKGFSQSTTKENSANSPNSLWDYFIENVSQFILKNLFKKDSEVQEFPPAKPPNWLLVEFSTFISQLFSIILPDDYMTDSNANESTPVLEKITESVENFFEIFKKHVLKIFEIFQSKLSYHNIVNSKEVTLYLFGKKYSNIKLDNNSLCFLQIERCDVIVFLIHGWQGSKDLPWYENMTNAFLNNSRSNYCVIQVDWHEPASYLYGFSVSQVKYVAEYIADFILTLNRTQNIGLDRFLPIGFSLGGQIVGFVGQKIQEKTGNKLSRIIALDPAGPLYLGQPKNSRLSEDDAKIVYVIHTNGGIFGYNQPCGTIDFFVNEGTFQPHCVPSSINNLSFDNFLSRCSHECGHELFIQAILHPQQYIAKKRCEPGLDRCERLEVSLGQLYITSKGKYDLKTESKFSEINKLVSRIIYVFSSIYTMVSNIIAGWFQ